MQLAVVVVAALLAANRPGPPSAQPSLRFSDYPASRASTSRAKDIDLSDPFVRYYRTLLRSALASGPDFAGHFRIVVIPGGTSIVSVVLLDTATGRVLAPAALEAVFFPDPDSYALSERFGIENRRYSRLLVVRGLPAAVESVGTYYFAFDGTDLQLVRGFRWRRHHPHSIAP